MSDKSNTCSNIYISILFSLLEVWYLQRFLHISNKIIGVWWVFACLPSNGLLMINNDQHVPTSTVDTLTLRLLTTGRGALHGMSSCTHFTGRSSCFRHKHVISLAFFVCLMLENSGIFMIMNHFPWWKTTLHRCKGSFVTFLANWQAISSILSL